MIPAYPLTWPAGWKRTQSRVDARFSKQERTYSGEHSYNRKRDLTVNDGTQRVLDSLQRMGYTRTVIISTNLELRLDGLPRSGQRKPNDPGVAVYWGDPGKQKVLAIDQYTDVADNLAACAATLEALRAVKRHGGGAILHRAFTGFAALPPPGGASARTWREVMGLGAGVDASGVRARYRELAMACHPDRGGSTDAMSELNRARDEALRAVGEEL